MIGWLLLLVAPLSLVGCASSTKEVSDAAVVHCAAPSRQQQTVEAAVVLRLVDSSSVGNSVVVNGVTHTFDEWREKQFPAFSKACSAMAEPQMRPAASSSGLPLWVTPLISFLAAALGAVISWFLTNRKDERVRGKQHAVALRTAGDEFASALYDYLDGQLRADSPTDAVLRAARVRLNQQLAVAMLLRPSWQMVKVVQTELTGILAEATEEEWRFERVKEELKPRAEVLTGRMEALDRRIGALASALERPREAKAILPAEFAQGVVA